MPKISPAKWGVQLVETGTVTMVFEPPGNAQVGQV
jgi:hypothetical protein